MFMCFFSVLSDKTRLMIGSKLALPRILTGSLLLPDGGGSKTSVK